jgi:hypothetical protein
MTGDGVDEVLLRWWNFTSNGVLGDLTSIRSHDSGIESLADIPESVARMVELLATPLQVQPASEPLPAAVKHSAVRGSEGHTLLDRWLLDGLPLDSLKAFEGELTEPSRVFAAQWKAGKTAVASLPVLVALRMVSILLQRPNPLFYRQPKTDQERLHSGQLIGFDSRWLLPTDSGATARARVSSSRTSVVIDPAWMFAAGSYLPDLFGQLVIDNGSSTWWSHDDLTQTAKQDNAPASLRGSAHTTRDPEDFRLFRSAGLGAAFLSKKLLARGLTYGSKRHAFLDRLTGPRSSKHLLAVSDYKQLRGFIAATRSGRGS